MMAVIIIQPHIIRPLTATTAIRIPITALLIVARSYAAASATTTLTARATTAAQFTATGTNLWRARMTHRCTALCADAFSRATKRLKISPRCSHEMRTLGTHEPHQRLPMFGYNIYFDLALFLWT